MPRTHIAREVTLTTSYAPIAATRTVAINACLSAPSANAGTAYLRGDDDSDSDVPLVPGEWHYFARVDLSTLYVKGAAGDKITVFGDA